jgi:DNA-binding NarL/FixJ family response regulator
LSAIEPIRKLAPSVKVLMLTMFSNSLYEVEAFQSGASGFLLKSYEVNEIAQLIHEAHENPDNPRLFPTIALRRKLELGGEDAAPGAAGRRFSLAGTWRRLWNGPGRQTVS